MSEKMTDGRIRLLCVEDDRDTAGLIAEEFIERGFDVRLAYDGQQGFAAILRTMPDLVISDISMPVMSGFELLEPLTEIAPRLDECERLRNALLTSVSHDLRTPLTSIIIALSALDAGFRFRTLATKRELVTTALREAMRLDRFIGNLLSMTRIEAGMLNLKPVPIDVAEVVEAAAERAAPLLERHRLEIEIPPDLPLALADFSLLEQVFFNLIDNAAKYSPKSSLITIAARAGSGQIVIDVRDQGPGIPPASLEAIFGRFTRIE